MGAGASASALSRVQSRGKGSILAELAKSVAQDSSDDDSDSESDSDSDSENDGDDSDSDSSDSSVVMEFEVEEGSGKNATRAEKRRAKRSAMEEEEATTRTLEDALANVDRAPESVDEFERLLVASPNSSVLWIQFMAFYLSQTQIDQARAVAEKALSTISFREEAEKLAVWVAFLNLENTHGTDESLASVFKRAVQYNDGFKVHEKLLEIYESTGKYEEADAQWDSTCRQFGKHYTRAWLGFFRFKLQHTDGTGARGVLKRALQSVPKRGHLGLTRKAAVLEFQHGSAERGRTLFEEMLATKPNRLDLWNLWLDQEIKHGSPKRVRTLFNRVVDRADSFKQDKVRKLFGKWMAWEASTGGDEDTVRDKAIAFVERLNEQSSSSSSSDDESS